MKKIARILCAVDLNDPSREVCEYAQTFARAFGTDLDVLYVAPSIDQFRDFELADDMVASFSAVVVNGAKSKLEAYVAENFKDVKPAYEVREGSAAGEIVSKAKEIGADLIVMGTHGRKGVNRMLFGSVAEKVLKNAGIPVMAIGPEEK